MAGNREIVQRLIYEDDLLTIQVTRSEARQIQKLIWPMVCKAEAELQGIRDNNSYTMPPQLVKLSIEDRKYQIDPWCSLVMWWRKLSDVFLEAIDDG